MELGRRKPRPAVRLFFHVAGDTARAATSDEVRDLRREAGALKEENRLLKKSVTADGEDAT